MAPRVRGRARGKAPLVLAPPSRSPSLSNIESAISISDDNDNNNDKEDETSSVPQFSLVERSVITVTHDYRVVAMLEGYWVILA
jgi:hypothetical protein